MDVYYSLHIQKKLENGNCSVESAERYTFILDEEGSVVVLHGLTYDLSAALYTIDHAFLLSCLRDNGDMYGVHDQALV